jgi:hypothetical protein
VLEKRSLPGRRSMTDRHRVAAEGDTALKLQCLKVASLLAPGAMSDRKFEIAHRVLEWVTTPVDPSTAARRRAASRAAPPRIAGRAAPDITALMLQDLLRRRVRGAPRMTDARASASGSMERTNSHSTSAR